MGQADPVSPDEILLRRVPFVEGNAYIDLSLPAPVQRAAFQPSTNDEDGLSLFRELFVTPEQIADLHRGKTAGKECYVVRVRAADLLDPAVGVDLVPNVVDDLPGHVLIPQLYKGRLTGEEKRKRKELQVAIASKLTMGDIVHFPNR